MYNLKEANLYLRNIKSGTFVVDKLIGIPLIRERAFQDVIPTTISNTKDEVNRNISLIAYIIDYDVIASNLVLVEVGVGPLHMMRTVGHQMTYVIIR